MNIVIVPRFKEIFDEPLPDLEHLLSSISSELIVGLLTVIHSELDLARRNFSVQ